MVFSSSQTTGRRRKRSTAETTVTSDTTVEVPESEADTAADTATG